MMDPQIYEMQLVLDDSNLIDGVYDYFLLAPNIENRSRAFFRKIKAKEIFDRIVIMDYANFHKEIDEEQEKQFYDEFEDYSLIVIKADDDTMAIRKLCQLSIKDDARIAFDITGFSIPNIYKIMHALKNVINIQHIDVYYTEPEFYIYEDGYFDSYHKNIGERNCAPILGYCNTGQDEREILTIFLGFDGGLADLVYYKLGEEGKEILQTLVVNGFPSYTSKLKDVSLFNNEGLINKIERENIFSAAANNPFETYNLLCTILENNKGILLNLCTIGSKPMALGTCLFALDHIEEVKVTYPFYEKKKFDAYEQAGKIWKYSINFV